MRGSIPGWLRCAVSAFLGFLVPVAAALAGEPQPRVDVTVDVPCHIHARVHGAAEFTQLTEALARRATYFPKDINRHFDFRAEGPADFFHNWVASKNDVPGYLPVYLETQRVLRWDRVAALGGMAALIAGAIALVAMRRARTAAHDLELAFVELTEAEARGGLFPIDGSLPERVGPYTVKRKLGAGGMAVVFEVESTNGQQLALKLPMPHLLESAEFRTRFTRELTVCMRLHHPNLIHIIDVNTGEEGGFPYPFLVMELVAGAPLDEHIATHGPARFDEAVELGCQLLDALHFIHQKGIVHRDVKPSNIMLTGKGRPKLMDFGVAYREETSGAKLTASEDRLGTPIYMAPEQFEQSRVDGRADIYALGLVLYEMLTGRLPFEGNDPLLVLQAKLCDDPPSLSHLRPDIPEALERCVMTMLARDPSSRFADAAAASAQLAAAGDRGASGTV